MKTKVEIIKNQVVVTTDFMKFKIAPKDEGEMSWNQAMEKGISLPPISAIMAVADNIKEVNEALKKVGGEPMEENKRYWCKEKCDASSAWFVSMSTAFVSLTYKSNGFLVRAFSAFEEIKPIKELEMKPFDLEAAKNDAKVCTRDGRPARIICFDRKGCPIVALIDDGKEGEKAYYYSNDGHYFNGGGNNPYDLMMVSEKQEGWINVYRDRVYKTEEEAKKFATEVYYITTTKVKWEE